MPGPTGNFGVVSQTALEVVESGGAQALVSQVVLEVNLQDAIIPIRVSQATLEVLASVPNTPRVSQTVLEVLCNYVNVVSISGSYVSVANAA